MNRALFIALIFFTQITFANGSVCYGETKKGKLIGGVKLPNNGANFVSYNTLGGILGRTYVHSKVKTVFLAAYKSLESNFPEKVFKYAETGFENGGKFSPHKTHQNGLSIDFMVPVLDTKGKSVHFPTNLLNKFGYSVEFSIDGKFDEYTIDFEALASHIRELDKAAKNNGFGLWRVIFDPKMQAKLLKTKYGEYLRKNVQFSKSRSWVRHDEHYHVDFNLPCEQL